MLTHLRHAAGAALLLAVLPATLAFAPAGVPSLRFSGASAGVCMTSPTSRAMPLPRAMPLLLGPRAPAPLRTLPFLGARPSTGGALRMAKGQEDEAEEEERDEIVVTDPISGKSIECYIDQDIEVDGKQYVLVYPCDTPVVLAYFDGGEQDLMPVPEDEVDKLFAAAYKACAEQELELINSAVVLTLQGDIEDLDEDADASGSAAGRRMRVAWDEDAFGEAGEDEEFVKVITSFKDGGMEYLVTEPLEPVLIIAKPSTKEAKAGDAREHYECLPEDEVERVMPKVEQILEERFDGEA
eukprot:CAMPEP_0180219252 /NCGR_PEP_ID=MMETSP0987-20121128/18323_1 /TAXON_ID=697907 /ORGANISM="non described non described, Strain CCMP2293" /LENGTH=296 /DNA_ID=CAMNT_0022179751 /DNA_START=65 /DNA_END=955 /DNA_ORIENTATION=+